MNKSFKKYLTTTFTKKYVRITFGCLTFKSSLILPFMPHPKTINKLTTEKTIKFLLFFKRFSLINNA